MRSLTSTVSNDVNYVKRPPNVPFPSHPGQVSRIAAWDGGAATKGLIRRQKELRATESQGFVDEG